MSLKKASAVVRINPYTEGAWGKYKTKERALEILDEIQSKIGNIYLCKIKSMVKTGDARMVKEYLEENYIGDFIMTDATMDIEPINKDVVMYEMPEK